MTAPLYIALRFATHRKRALLVDQALVVKRGIVQRRTIKVGFRTLDFAEALSGGAGNGNR